MCVCVCVCECVCVCLLLLPSLSRPLSCLRSWCVGLTGEMDIFQQSSAIELIRSRNGHAPRTSPNVIRCVSQPSFQHLNVILTHHGSFARERERETERERQTDRETERQR